ncbi:hypothetical protein DRE_04411 [Drechslerella stenobrocha 248]|uniref:Uncharacterized protein n=1 Tax=Drechslerella stenobrocha 248 TaxID=1043628 RepID=W7IAZ5_9PEZI|nr:hypothetical protein DRE_04411 [Drechslerella stenobrocha 248]
MRLRTSIPYLAAGLCALHSASVYAELGALPLAEFDQWVLNSDANAPYWQDISTDLEELVTSVLATHTLDIDEVNGRTETSLGPLFDNVRSILTELHMRENFAVQPPQRTENIGGDPNSIYGQQQDERPTFWSEAIVNLRDTFNWLVNLRQDINWDTGDKHDIWESRAGLNVLGKVPLLDTVKDLATYISENVDVSDTTQVARWVVDGRVDGETSVLTYDIGSRQRLQAAFKTVHDAFQSLGNLLTPLFFEAQRRLKQPTDKMYLQALQKALLDLQGFCRKYQRIFG